MSRRSSLPEQLLALAGGYVLWKVAEQFLTGAPSYTRPMVDPFDSDVLKNLKSTEVPRVATPATAEAMKNAFTRAFHAGLDRAPSPDELAMLMAHSAIETTRWRAMYNWNAGNVTTSSRGYFLNPPSDTRHHYAAYTDLDQGAGALVSLVIRRYPKAFLAATAGDPKAYAHELKALGYYEADEPDYYDGRGKGLGILGLFREYRAQLT